MLIDTALKLRRHIEDEEVWFQVNGSDAEFSHIVKLNGDFN
ncbi:MAG: hypothetical protein RMX96_06685 [Nostoc sp. ChiSLP02]|nr:hypothetical protein [Nostoc sp. DedSLP05]MDZ8099480.1 hypothetical protein [Nostoc sp. DedSLP01]MDZ8184520.1 hypothetical protein [Nostoc sp. ChiSLP02]